VEKRLRAFSRLHIRRAAGGRSLAAKKPPAFRPLYFVIY
jgi:hypothetical protein